MSEKHPQPSLKDKIISFWRSEDKIPSAIREILSVLITVGVIVAILLLVCGTWPAIVTIESESMVPHMNVGDLVVVVAQDRFGALQSLEEGNTTGYEKYGMPGDVVIYRPNGIVNYPRDVVEPTRNVVNDIRYYIWNLIGWNQVHPIIHRAMYWVEEGEPIPTRNGTRVEMGPAVHEGYITKGDNNPVIDQIGWVNYRGLGGPIEPVKKEWILGKALITIPLVGYLPLNIIPVIILVIIVMIIHELYIRSKEKKRKEEEKRYKKRKKA